VVLHARAVTHVLVEGPGGRVFINRILHPGDAYRVPDLVGLSLTTPDGGAVLLELDGQEVSSAGRAGQMTEALSLDPQAIVDRAHGGNPG
jgi:cytoskeleton protein RodZ